jgi:hypothetical protein
MIKQKILYLDPNRTIDTYMASLGLSGGYDAFMARADQQSKDNWDPRFTAAAVNNYIRAGFGMGTTVSPPPPVAPPPPPSTCTENWSCSNWGSCSTSGTQSRTCTDLNACGTTNFKPSLTQSCTPPIQPSTFAIGTRVKTTANLNVRAKASNGKGIKILCTQPAGSMGTIKGGPASAGGYTWWNINYDTSCDGWSVQSYLTPSLAMSNADQVAAAGSTVESLEVLVEQLKALLTQLQSR